MQSHQYAWKSFVLVLARLALAKSTNFEMCDRISPNVFVDPVPYGQNDVLHSYDLPVSRGVGARLDALRSIAA